jgi:hypothetical protein
VPVLNPLGKGKPQINQVLLSAAASLLWLKAPKSPHTLNFGLGNYENIIRATSYPRPKDGFTVWYQDHANGRGRVRSSTSVHWLREGLFSPKSGFTIRGPIRSMPFFVLARYCTRGAWPLQHVVGRHVYNIKRNSGLVPKVACCGLYSTCLCSNEDAPCGRDRKWSALCG